MRSTTAYYLVLIYITVVIKPLIPFIQDGWDHEFNAIEHISVVHAQYGNNHLEKELSRTDADNDKSKNQHTLRSGEDVPFHVLTQACRYEVSPNRCAEIHFFYKYSMLPTVYILSQGQPPQFS